MSNMWNYVPTLQWFLASMLVGEHQNTPSVTLLHQKGALSVSCRAELRASQVTLCPLAGVIIIKIDAMPAPG